MGNYADLILRNGSVFNGIDLESFTGSVAVKGNKILSVGTTDEIDALAGQDTTVIDCTGKMISPGFNDGHTHIPYGAFLIDPDFGLDLNGSIEYGEYLPKLKAFADQHPNNEWVYGFNGGWGADSIPNRKILDEVFPDRPAIVQHMDGHSMVVNTQSILKAGIDDNSIPPAGGRYGKFDDGTLNGIMYDDATFSFSEKLYNPPDEEFKRIYKRFLDYAKAFGITAAGDLFPVFVGKEDVYSIFKELEEEDALTLRMQFAVSLIHFEAEEYKKTCEKYNSAKLRCKGTKDLVDGVITVHTALMLQPYSDDPSTCGCTAHEPEELRKGVLRSCEAGVPVRMHCIGDGAVRMGLDFLEEAEALYGYHGERHGIEHIESIDPDDIDRFQKLHICANMQPMHTVFDTEAEERFRGERCKWCWPMRDLLDSGAVMSMGTDFPIVGLNPFHSLYAAVTRKDPFGKMNEGWQMHQAISIEEAMKAHTWGSAYSQGREDEIGSLKEGLFADIAVIDRDLFSVPAEEIKNANVDVTIFDGKVIYER